MNVNMDLEFEFYDDYSNSTVDEMFEEEFSSESISYWVKLTENLNQ